jgi:hypothetical protein
VGLLPGRDVGVVVFANRDHTELRHAVMWRVFDAYLGGEPRDWSADLKVLYDSLDARQAAVRAEREARRVADTRPSLPLERYAGSYADSAYGAVTVTLAEGVLRFSRSAFLTGSLEHWHFDSFRVRWDNGWITPDLVTFRLAADGGVTGLAARGLELRRQPAADSP